MNQRTKQGLWAGGASVLLLAALWAYCAFGGVVASSNSPTSGSIYYRVVVRRIPFEAAPTFEATLYFNGDKRLMSQRFSRESSDVKHVAVTWNGPQDFTILFDETPARCTFIPWKSTHWQYGASK